MIERLYYENQGHQHVSRLSKSFKIRKRKQSLLNKTKISINEKKYANPTQDAQMFVKMVYKVRETGSFKHEGISLILFYAEF